MFTINKENNRIEKIHSTTFKELGFREREHLQEWIANNPSCLNEELLIIQKEFDGFHDTNERLDLLAIDKQGNLVVIENKLDDTGRDVTWQVQKYASYCSTLNAVEICNIFGQYLSKNGSLAKADELLQEFLETDDYREKLNVGNSQRIVMIAGEFRKEVTSTVLWLLNFGLRIQCFKATPYKIKDQLLVNFEQIIPIKEAEDFVISLAKKSREEVAVKEEMKERHILRKEFWTLLLKEMNTVTDLYKNVSPSKDHWLNAGSGVSGIHYECLATYYYAGIELAITGYDTDTNKMIFDELLKSKDAIEQQFGATLSWERLEYRKMCRIKYSLEEVDIFDKEDWSKMINFMVEQMPKFEKVMENYVLQIGRKLKGG